MNQLRNGECTPFLGGGVCHPTLPTDSHLSAVWAARYAYPFPDSMAELPRVMQYATTVEGEGVYVKEQLREELAARGQPDFSDLSEPHALLAELPLKVYVTTNYDNFMVSALRASGKDPRALACLWDDPLSEIGAPSLDPDPPMVENPIVFHLYGSFEDPRTLVLTEDDYLDFVANLSANRTTMQRIVPTSVLPALKNAPLLFIGYRYGDWNFRVLFHSLLRTLAPVHLRRHISVQLAPSEDGETGLDARARDYLDRYFDRRNITVFWGTTAEFCQRLRFLMGPA
ncbi:MULTISPECIES: SIR2 family protein [unclassified Pseudofrankia]|uniref:SIR2 family NAD-dependent protein deacylase n=1 Tax=unclassified Pseudofrankia TaxID=2994372 RepID=UPI0008D9238D|nr:MULTISPECIES: SIR2 family protein [unclassified Pseudofrankia]MDT3444371.1 SIR2 family protein [Pseudofrankia sp. BMG5.37]OHV56503.1 hypothetical protein BCD48_08575 [Pseudofrankia sp. BMG5.36]